MFPIHDRQGRVIGGGRFWEGDGPKYLNSPETNLFNKRHQLYGMYLAKDAIRAGQQSWLRVMDDYLPPFGNQNVVAFGDSPQSRTSRSLAVMARRRIVTMLTWPSAPACGPGDAH